jgi:hypothetical protein
MSADRQWPTDKQYRGVLVNTDFTRQRCDPLTETVLRLTESPPTVECLFLVSLEAIHLSGLLQLEEYSVHAALGRGVLNRCNSKSYSRT